jgi:DNA mismatch repair ATPase MutS
VRTGGPKKAHKTMNAFLMYRDRNFAFASLPRGADPASALPSDAKDLVQDLELGRLFSTMAAGDKFLYEVAQAAVLTSLQEPDEIRYRQQILADCLERPAIVRDLYSIAVDAIEAEKTVWGAIFAKYPEGLLRRSVDVLKLFVHFLKRFRFIADEHAASFRSEGLTRFFRVLACELDDEYLSSIERHLAKLSFRNGILISAELGDGNKAKNYVVRSPLHVAQTWTERMKNWMGEVVTKTRSRYVYELDSRDESGFQALSELRAETVSHLAAAVGQSADHISQFLNALKSELAFYIGCLNLRDYLTEKGGPTCFPDVFPVDGDMLSARGLYDVCLAVTMDNRVVGSDIRGDGRSLVMITGANRGGKTTFLRSMGLAQLMMQCGMFVSAESFSANICRSIFTHFKREEDASMKMGKLDEELSRMSSIIDRMQPRSLALLNESFASTNEREGSEIARQIVRAILESSIRVLYVTHLFDLAHGFYLEHLDNTLFLRAERLPDGRRTFQVIEGEPLPTSYGEDLYRRIFSTTTN